MASTQGQTIRIKDFLNPDHSEAATAAIGMIEHVPFDLSVEGVVSAAREQCDVPLFEDEDWNRRLGDYIGHVLADPHYTRMGQFGTFNSLVRYLVQRSRLEALYLAHPEIDDIEIERPLIIAGLPRSGTSHLLNLIGADSRLRALRRWESQEPIPRHCLQPQLTSTSSRPTFEDPSSPSAPRLLTNLQERRISTICRSLAPSSAMASSSATTNYAEAAGQEIYMFSTPASWGGV